MKNRMMLPLARQFPGVYYFRDPAGGLITIWDRKLVQSPRTAGPKFLSRLCNDVAVPPQGSDIRCEIHVHAGRCGATLTPTPEGPSLFRSEPVEDESMTRVYDERLDRERNWTVAQAMQEQGLHQYDYIYAIYVVRICHESSSDEGLSAIEIYRALQNRNILPMLEQVLELKGW